MMLNSGVGFAKAAIEAAGMHSQWVNLNILRPTDAINRHWLRILVYVCSHC